METAVRPRVRIFQTKNCIDCGTSYSAFPQERVPRCAPCARAQARFLISISQMVGRALEANIIVKQPCEVCGEKQSEAHHDDYSQPLSVRWLCRAHHRQHHEQEWRAARVSQQGDAR